MSLVLGANEHVVKDWHYATSNGKTGTTEHSLTVTDRRIVAHETAKNSAHHVELAVEEVTGIDMSYSKKINTFGVVLLLLGIIFVALGGILMSNGANTALVPLILGAVCVIAGTIVLIFFSKARLVVNLYSKIKPDGVLGVYANSIPPVFRSKRGKVTKVSVNPEVAKDIVAVLGSVVLAK